MIDGNGVDSCPVLESPYIFLGAGLVALAYSPLHFAFIGGGPIHWYLPRIFLSLLTLYFGILVFRHKDMAGMW